jgi:hypothetical protein
MKLGVDVANLQKETRFPASVESDSNPCWKWICEVRTTCFLNPYDYTT